MRHVQILGTRGIPARHGGFETFAQHLALYLVERDWNVSVFCQEAGSGAPYEDSWRGVRRCVIPITRTGALGTVLFDVKSMAHAAREEGIGLVLGYNTAVFGLLARMRGKRIIMNMDGIEWKRDKWSRSERAWLRANEFIGARIAHTLIADHPEIASHLVASARVNPQKIRMIPYGADAIHHSDPALIRHLGLSPGAYSILIARPEPENSVREVVAAFSRQRRKHTLVVLGEFEPSSNAYHRSVLESARKEVLFPGAIYDANIVGALRYYARVYFHGHTVGGTNPSLVEALGAGNPVIARDNAFNRWVAGGGARYFSSIDECDEILSMLLDDEPTLMEMKRSARQRHEERFTWSRVLQQYEDLLCRELK